jgi:hypothetical protein
MSFGVGPIVKDVETVAGVGGADYQTAYVIGRGCVDLLPTLLVGDIDCARRRLPSQPELGTPDAAKRVTLPILVQDAHAED